MQPHGLVAQLGEQLPCTQKVVGSIPTRSTHRTKNDGPYTSHTRPLLADLYVRRYVRVASGDLPQGRLVEWQGTWLQTRRSRVRIPPRPPRRRESHAESPDCDSLDSRRVGSTVERQFYTLRVGGSNPSPGTEDIMDTQTSGSLDEPEMITPGRVAQGVGALG